MEDNRRSPRFELSFPVIYYPEDNVQQFRYTVSKNISRGGLCIPVISNIIKNGDSIKMEIWGNKERCISVIGKVRWVKMLDRGVSLNREATEFTPDEEAGVEFTNVPFADTDNLLDFRRAAGEPAIFGLKNT